MLAAHMLAVVLTHSQVHADVQDEQQTTETDVIITNFELNSPKSSIYYYCRC